MSLVSLKKNLQNKKINQENLNKNANDLLIEYGQYIKKIFPNVKIHLLNNDLYIVTKKESLHNLAYFLKYHTNSQFKALIDLGVIDYPQKKNRFELNYLFLSIQYNTRITVVTYTQDSFPVRSLTDIFKSSN
jgi:NADH dehydrogenase (ubiquinone) Fe-S protein 3